MDHTISGLNLILKTKDWTKVETKQKSRLNPEGQIPIGCLNYSIILYKYTVRVENPFLD